MYKVFFSLAACCLFFCSAAAHDDLYFNPKRQRELNRQEAERRASQPSFSGLKRGSEAQQQQESRYTESWGDVDSLESRPNSTIYEITRDDEYGSERDEDSYAARLRYDDPTYVVYVRDPYWYDPWWRYPHAGVYGTWGDRWGWGLSWGYPYYGYGYGYGWDWGYPYYGWGHTHHYYPYHPWHQWGGHPVAEARGTHRGSSMSGTGRGTGYTHSRNSSGTYSRSRLTVPAGTYTQRRQGSYAASPAAQQGATGSTGSRTTYSNSGRSYQSIPSSSSSSQSSGSAASSRSSYSGSSSSGSGSSYSGGSSSSSRSSYSGSSSSSSSSSSRSSGSSSGGRRSSGR
jgi:hypothetical protein